VNYAYWPIVLAGDWCGEFRSKAPQKAASLPSTHRVIDHVAI
jgi:hypothetical protein